MNAALQRRLISLQGGLDCMLALGFTRLVEGEEAYLYLNNIHPELAQIKSQLESALRSVPGALQSSTPTSAPFPSASSPNPPAPSPMMPNMNSMLSNPMLQAAQANPQLMQQAMQSIQNSPLFANNPLLQQLASDPNIVQQAMQLAQNPQRMAELAQSMQHSPLFQGLQGGFNGQGGAGAETIPQDQVAQLQNLMRGFGGLGDFTTGARQPASAPAPSAPNDGMRAQPSAPSEEDLTEEEQLQQALNLSLQEDAKKKQDKKD